MRYFNMAIPFHMYPELPANIKHLIESYYHALDEKELWKKCLHDVVVDSYETWLELMKRQIVIAVVDRNNGDICAHGMYNNKYGRVIFAHFGIHPQWLGKDEEGNNMPQMICQQSIVQLFNMKDSRNHDRAWVTSLIGVTPMSNKLALRFSRKKLNFQPLAIIPELCYNAYNNTFEAGMVSILKKEIVTKWGEKWAVSEETHKVQEEDSEESAQIHSI